MIEQFLQEIVQLIYGLPPLSIYLVFFVVAYVENIIPPIPGDILVAFGGYMAAESVVGIIPVLLLTTVASVIGFMNVYWIGSHWGYRIKDENYWLLRFIPLKYLNKVQDWMRRWGLGVVLANRFLAGTRSVISLTAGFSHTPLGSTVLCSTISSILWNGILLASGWIVHENWKIIGDYLSAYGKIVLGLIVLFIIVRLAMYYYRKKKSVPRN